MEKLQLINRIKSILNDGNCKLEKDSDGSILLYQGVYPEDCISLIHEPQNDRYIIYEIHRDRKKVIAEVKDAEAAIYTVIAYKSKYDDPTNNRNVIRIRDYMELGEEKKAWAIIEECFEESLYSIGHEEHLKVSLIKEEDKVSVKFEGEYLVQDVAINRGYIVLYNYCEKLHFISLFYNELQRKINCDISFEKISKFYILGHL